ncbi:SGNH hydrolase domain-containing protein [Mycobacterium sp. ITM-2016-00317]|uniref:SGNH hydrolase domain-containing protein n=1 Tax=Mycobacterium sp. ITM-2016-00317 TaxID=2099694 RepID=UPI000D4C0661|nr:SGNH hydrolase domain-containing protein [Mycobacterium sp. ITM-2016-00317]WNG86182.1 SGNH hydrolase domain-containing protein [Mycobacterium sp. ITM-2016-00317]
MAMRLPTTAIAGVAMCTALMLAGCQAVVADQTAPVAETESAPAPAAIPQAEVLRAVQAATELRDLPAGITNDELLAASGDYTDQWSIEGCEPSLTESRLDDIGPCTLGDTTSERTMVLIGDSAASMWHRALDLIGQRNGWRVIVLAKSNCGPASLTYYQWQLERAYTECDDWQQWRMEIIGQERAEIVVMAGFFDGGNQGPGKDTTPEVWRDALVKTIRALPEGTKTFMLGNIPRPPESPSECVADNPTDLTRCAVPAVEVLPNQEGWSGAAELTGQTYVDVDPWFCAEVCPAVIADHLVYSGKHHITAQTAQYLSGSIEEVMAPALTVPR